MRLLLNSKATEPYYTKYPEWFGWLFTPFIKNKPILDIPYYSDNGAFAKSKPFTDHNYQRHIEYCAKVGVNWLTAPDCVGNSVETNRLFRVWLDRLQCVPIAYVLQDGIKIDEIPFNECVCVFLGGSTEFKLSDYALKLCYTAKERGKMVHIGRVNTIKRIKHFEGIADTIDGSSWSRFANSTLPDFIRYKESL